MRFDWLKKKELGLPLWAWTLIAAVFLFVLYRHYKNSGGGSSSSQTSSGQAPADTAIPAGYDSSGGGGFTGGAADNSGALASIASGIDSLAQGQNDLLSAFQTPPTDTSTSDGNGSNPTGTTQTVSTPNGIQWGGTTFTTRAQFDAWLKARGEGWKEYALKYPQAYAEYLKLPAGKPPTAKGSPIVKGGPEKPPSRSPVAKGNPPVLSKKPTSPPKKSSVKKIPQKTGPKKAPVKKPIGGHI